MVKIPKCPFLTHTLMADYTLVSLQKKGLPLPHPHQHHGTTPVRNINASNSTLMTVVLLHLERYKEGLVKWQSHQKRDSFTGVYHNESGEGVRVLIVANGDVLDSYYKLL